MPILEEEDSLMQKFIMAQKEEKRNIKLIELGKQTKLN